MVSNFFRSLAVVVAVCSFMVDGQEDYNHGLRIFDTAGDGLCMSEYLELFETTYDVDTGSWESVEIQSKGLTITSFHKDANNWRRSLSSTYSYDVACFLWYFLPLSEYTLDFIRVTTVPYNIDQVSLIDLVAPEVYPIPPEATEFVLPEAFLAETVASSGSSNYTIYEGANFDGAAYCLNTFDEFAEWGWGVLHAPIVFGQHRPIRSIRKNVCEGTLLRQPPAQFNTRSCIKNSNGQLTYEC